MKNNRLRIPEGVNKMTAAEYQRLVSGEAPKQTKYRNIITEVNGLKFDSKKEAKRYTQLLLMKNTGLIKDFKRQVKYVLLDKVKGLFRQRSYYADFVIEHNDGSIEVEDVKGLQTQMYRLKKHLMYVKYKIIIKEI